MDQLKIGRFIQLKRKEKGLTQAELAEMLNITDRAVSKWERGIAMPDSSIMLELCRILGITVTDLLNGEMVDMENYSNKNEQAIMETLKMKEKSDKLLLRAEVFIVVASIALLLVVSALCAIFVKSEGLAAAIVLVTLASIMPGLLFAMRIEQVAGYYECKHCHHRYVPEFKNVFCAMHVNRNRYMKCPNCKKWSFNKKVLQQNDED